jgi:hypothetical protein
MIVWQCINPVFNANYYPTVGDVCQLKFELG